MNELSVTFFKTCTKCGCFKPATTDFFYSRSQAKSGLQAYCKICGSAYGREYCVRNRDALLKRWSEYRLENLGKRSEQFKQYYEQNRDVIMARSRRWYQENKEARLAWERVYHKKNPGIKRGKNRRRRARKLNAQCTPYTDADVADLWYAQGGNCAYCAVPLFGDYHLDHVVPLSRGGADALTNIVLACPSCNLRKGVKTGEEFEEWLRALAYTEKSKGEDVA